MLFKNKKGVVSFGSIVAIIGSILIIVGIAWLIAKNWHYMSSALKIIILVIVTVTSYSLAIYIRVKTYSKIAEAFFVLGSLLYTLSIFLIAQIFHLGTSLQETAWLYFLAWAGVILISYIYNSAPSLVIGLIEFVIWLVMQFYAIEERGIPSYKPSIAILALCLLSVGILLYGLSLIHRTKNHRFARVYQFWTAFYFLGFAYTLSFQSTLPTIWENARLLSSSTYFFFGILVVALVVTIIGIINSLNNKSVEKKELLGFMGTVTLLVIIIASTALVTNLMGGCYQKNCYEFVDKDSCEKAPKQLGCSWNDNYCSNDLDKNCYRNKDIVSCQSSDACKWEINQWGGNDYCAERTCNDYKDENLCLDAPKNLKCEWANASASDCIDSDGGLNYYVKGRTCGGNTCVEDSCSDSTYLMEYICKGNVPYPQPFKCPDGCQAGACINNNTNNSINMLDLQRQGLSICRQKNCYDYKDQDLCSKSNCYWGNNYCSEKNCYDYIDEASCNAETDLKCYWYGSYCQEERPCEKYNNNYKECTKQELCSWRAGYSYGYFGMLGYENPGLPFMMWAVWIFINIAFILIILGIIGYGTWQKLPKIINMGIVFFSLDIISRYIGFMMDYWAYTSLAVVFITGGILLLGGGYLIEKWRRKMIGKTKQENMQINPQQNLQQTNIPK